MGYHADDKFFLPNHYILLFFELLWLFQDALNQMKKISEIEGSSGQRLNWD